MANSPRRGFVTQQCIISKRCLSEETKWGLYSKADIFKTIEPPHDKTNTMTFAPSEDTDQPGHPPRVFALHTNKHWVLSYTWSVLRILWSDWADAKDNTFSGQRLRPVGHTDSQRNKPNYYIIIRNVLKVKYLSRQSRERVFWQLLIVSC